MGGIMDGIGKELQKQNEAEAVAKKAAEEAGKKAAAEQQRHEENKRQGMVNPGG